MHPSKSAGNTTTAGQVVGRVGYDNCIVHLANGCGQMTDVVDASRTLHALHQTVGDGNWAGHREVADKTWNTDRCP